MRMMVVVMVFVVISSEMFVLIGNFVRFYVWMKLLKLNGVGSENVLLLIVWLVVLSDIEIVMYSGSRMVMVYRIRMIVFD